MAEDVTQVGKFVGLPIKELLVAPITAAAEGQNLLNKVTLDALDDLAFDYTGVVRNADGKIISGKPKAKTIDFDMTRLVADPNSTTGYSEITFPVKAPVLSLVNPPVLSMDRITVDFSMELKETITDTNTSNKNATVSSETDTSGSYSGGFLFNKVHGSVSNKTIITGALSSSREQTRASDFSAKYHARIEAVRVAPAEGLAKLTQIFASVLEPLPATGSDSEGAA